MGYNEPVVFSPVYKSLSDSNVSFSKTVHCSISFTLVSGLINSEPVKSLLNFVWANLLDLVILL